MEELLYSGSCAPKLFTCPYLWFNFRISSHETRPLDCPPGKPYGAARIPRLGTTKGSKSGSPPAKNEKKCRAIISERKPVHVSTIHCILAS